MTKITCGVKKCAYNTDGGCKLEKITVGTKNAHMSDETKCESFTECSSCAVNSCGCRDEARKSASVKCAAEHCTYNDKGMCEAKKIEIATCHTVGCSETQCHTFKNE